MNHQLSSQNKESTESSSELIPQIKHYGRTREEQIEINKKGLEILRRWREEKLSDSEAKAAEKTWEKVKQIIDDNRCRKLFS